MYGIISQKTNHDTTKCLTPCMNQQMFSMREMFTIFLTQSQTLPYVTLWIHKAPYINTGMNGKPYMAVTTTVIFNTLPSAMIFYRLCSSSALNIVINQHWIC